MRVNIYAEEMTDRIQIISKEIEGQQFTGLRFYLELPATVGGKQYQGPFMHHPGDDDSAAVTFWGKRDLREVLVKALAALERHYSERRIQRFNKTYDENAMTNKGTGPEREARTAAGVGADRNGRPDSSAGAAAPTEGPVAEVKITRANYTGHVTGVLWTDLGVDRLPDGKHKLYAAPTAAPAPSPPMQPARELLREARDKLFEAEVVQSWSYVRQVIAKLDASLSPDRSAGPDTDKKLGGS